jgi:sugar-specific transcriptional regulator TrmB
MARLSEARKKLRDLLRRIRNRLRIIYSAAKPVIRRALTKEVQYGVALLRGVGTELMAKLDETISDPELRGKKWLEEMTAFLKEKAAEVGGEYGDKVRIRTSALTLVREILYQSYKETKE